MSEPAWYRSLYWRIAAGLVAFLALMLAAQGLLFIFLTDRLAGSMPARSPRQLAVLAAADTAGALARDPDLDVSRHVEEHYGRVVQPLVIALRDGRVASNHLELIPDVMLAAIRRQAAVSGRPRRARPTPDAGASDDPETPPRIEAPQGSEERPRRPRPVFPGFGPGVALRRFAEVEPIFVSGERAGIVAVPLGRPPFSLLVRELGPTMGLVGLVVLVVGGTGMAFMVFGPARRRLRKLQEATERLGQGDLSARAPESGGDEVAELAASFNQMAAELAVRAEALRASNQARRQLLADVSHELMTPLTAMRGYIETLSMQELALDSPTRDRYLGIVDEETRRMERIVGDLLDLARFEGGGPDVRMDTVSVTALFDRVASRHERELTRRGITLRRHVGPGAEQVRGDPDRLEQALQNLAGNALRHTPDGGDIALSAAAHAGTLTLSVRDSGPGIPPAHLPLIFDRFYKVDAARRAGSGSGLGLSIVKAIVERHGGTISARNDGGAVFDIALPAA